MDMKRFPLAFAAAAMAAVSSFAAGEATPAPAPAAAVQPALTPDSLKGEWLVDAAHTAAARRTANALSEADAAAIQKRLEDLKPAFRFDGASEQFTVSGGGWSRAYTAEARGETVAVMTRRIGSDEQETAIAAAAGDGRICFEQANGERFILRKLEEKAAPKPAASVVTKKPGAGKKLTPELLKGDWTLDIGKSIEATMDQMRETGQDAERIAQLEQSMRRDMPPGAFLFSFDGATASVQMGDNEQEKKEYTAKADGNSLLVTIDHDTMKATLLEDGRLSVQPQQAHGGDPMVVILRRLEEPKTEEPKKEEPKKAEPTKAAAP